MTREKTRALTAYDLTCSPSSKRLPNRLESGMKKENLCTTISLMLISLGKLCQLFNTVLITLLISVSYIPRNNQLQVGKNILITKNKFVILYQVNQTFKAFLYNLTLRKGGKGISYSGL